MLAALDWQPLQVVEKTSIVMPAPPIALASDGPYIAIALGHFGHDCDRVYVWAYNQPQAVRLGRGTRCAPGSRVTALSIARDRALWLHRIDAAGTVWTLWTASRKRAKPRLLARVAGVAGRAPPIVVGEGNYDRRQGFGTGDVLPYAIGDTVTVLRADGSLRFRWTAPDRVVALASQPDVLVVGVADGRVFLLEEGPTVVNTYDGTPAASSLFFWGDLAIQRGRTIQVRGSDCTRDFALPPDEQLVGWGEFMVVRRGPTIRVESTCKPHLFFSTRGTLATLDFERLTVAQGRVVTDRLFF